MEYKLDIKHQLRSFRECWVTLGWTMAPLIVGPLIIKEMDYGTMFVICLLIWLITSVGMTLPFHLNYLLANWKTRLIVDNTSKTIRVIESGNSSEYNFSDIQVTRYIGGHYRPDRTKSWMAIPFDYYGYLKITTIDNKEIYLTSLMLDPFKPPLQVNKTEYGFTIIWKR